MSPIIPLKVMMNTHQVTRNTYNGLVTRVSIPCVTTSDLDDPPPCPPHLLLALPEPARARRDAALSDKPEDEDQ